VKNYFYFADKSPRAASNLVDTVAQPAFKTLDGIAFSTDPLAAVLRHDFSNYYRAVSFVPPNFDFCIGLHADSLTPAGRYPFETIIIENGEQGGITTPNPADPAFWACLAEAAFVLSQRVEDDKQIDRVTGINISPFGSTTTGGGQFHLPYAKGQTPAQNMAFWLDKGVTHEVVTQFMLKHAQLVSSYFPKANIHCAILCPYNDWITGEADAGVSYSALVNALLETQLQTPFSVVDQTLKAPNERNIIRKVAEGHPYLCQIATIPPSDEATIIATYELAKSYNPLWCEWQGYMVPILSKYIAQQGASK
jgi:hypothetical protein